MPPPSLGDPNSNAPRAGADRFLPASRVMGLSGGRWRPLPRISAGEGRGGVFSAVQTGDMGNAYADERRNRVFCGSRPLDRLVGRSRCSPHLLKFILQMPQFAIEI